MSCIPRLVRGLRLSNSVGLSHFKIQRPLKCIRHSLRPLCTSTNENLQPVEKARAEPEDSKKYSTDKTQGRTSIPGHYPSKLDRMTLILTGTMAAADIKNEVSHETMEKANTRRRIYVNIFFVVITIFGSIWAIRRGKIASKEQNLYEQNAERYETVKK